MTRIFAATLVLAAFAAPALADDQCQQDVAKLDQAITSQELDADVKAQAEDLRNNAVQLCGAGNMDEGLQVTAEAKALLQIE
jgi:hypothetical protein